MMCCEIHWKWSLKKVLLWWWSFWLVWIVNYRFEFICPGFPLLNKMNQVIIYMKDSGIMNKLYDDFIFNSTILERIHAPDYTDHSLHVVLTYSHVEGAFSFAIVGLAISCSVFLGEIIFHKFVSRLARTKRLKGKHMNKRVRFVDSWFMMSWLMALAIDDAYEYYGKLWKMKRMKRSWLLIFYLKIF